MSMRMGMADFGSVVMLRTRSRPFVWVLRCFGCDWGYTVAGFMAAKTTATEHASEHGHSRVLTADSLDILLAAIDEGEAKRSARREVT